MNTQIKRSSRILFRDTVFYSAPSGRLVNRDRQTITMTIILNGEKKDIPPGLTVNALLEHLNIRPERVAVEINEEIIRKATYQEVAVKENDRVEVVQFMGGGSAA